MGCKSSRLDALILKQAELDSLRAKHDVQQDAFIKKQAELDSLRAKNDTQQELMRILLPLLSRGQRVELATRPLLIVEQDQFEFVANEAEKLMDRQLEACMPPNGKNLLNDRSHENVSKDQRRMVLICAPPRHGKSLMLDRLFDTRADVRVLPITFNSTTTILARDVSPEDTSIGPWHVVVRLFHLEWPSSGWYLSLLRALRKCFPTPSDAFDYLRYAVSSFRPDRLIVVAMDELSALTDVLTESQVAALADFFGTYLGKQIRFVATMFHVESLQTPSTGLSGVSHPPLFLSWQSPEASMPLMVAILQRWRTSTDDGFPTMLWEICKTSPGLLGELWQQVCLESQCPNSFAILSVAGFLVRLKWYNALCVAHARTPCVQLLVKLLVKELNGNPELDTSDDDISSKREFLIKISAVQQQVATKRLDVVPFALVALLMQTPGSDDDDRTKYLRSAIMSSNQRKILLTGRDLTVSDGGPYESFTLNALRLRALCSATTTVKPFPIEQWFRWSWGKIVIDAYANNSSGGAPPPTYVTFPAIGAVPETHFGFVFGKVALQWLLTPTLYALFPTGCDDLAQFVLDQDRSVSPLQVARLFTEAQTGPSPVTVCHRVTHLLRSCSSGANEEDPVGADAGFSVRPKDEVIAVKGPFPTALTKEKMSDVCQRLLENANMTCFVQPTQEGNPGCEFALGTCWDATKVFEFIFIELKDRRDLNTKEIKTKMDHLTGAWQPVEMFGGKITFNGEPWTVRQLIVFAGRCDIAVEINNQARHAKEAAEAAASF